MRLLRDKELSEWLDALPSLDEEEAEASGEEIRKDVRPLTDEGSSPIGQSNPAE